MSDSVMDYGSENSFDLAKVINMGVNYEQVAKFKPTSNFSQLEHIGPISATWGINSVFSHSTWTHHFHLGIPFNKTKNNQSSSKQLCFMSVFSSIYWLYNF